MPSGVHSATVDVGGARVPVGAAPHFAARQGTLASVARCSGEMAISGRCRDLAEGVLAMSRTRRWAVAALFATLLLGGIALQPREAVEAAICPAVGSHCYGNTGWQGTPGTWSGGATSILVPLMVFNDPNEVLTNEMWVIDNAGHWVEVGAYAGHPWGSGQQGRMIYFYGQLAANGVWQGDRLADIPAGDIGQWSNFYIFNCILGQQWCVVVESLNLGALTTQLAPNTMLANWQHIGAELSNESNTGNQASSGEARWANTRYRTNGGAYYPQAQYGAFQNTPNPPFIAGWTSAPPGGQWYARTTP